MDMEGKSVLISSGMSAWSADLTGFFLETDPLSGASLVAQMVKNPPEMQETWV